MNVQNQLKEIKIPAVRKTGGSMSEKKHMRELDVMSVIMAFMVMFIHISSQAVTKLNVLSVPHIAVFIPWRISMYAVQAFIFTSAVKFMLGFRSRKLNYGKYMVNRVKKIILPYIAANVIYYIYFVNNDYFPFEITKLIKYICNGELVAPFYFVLIITQFYLLAPLWIYLVNKISPKTLMIVSAAATVLWSAVLPALMSRYFPSVNAVALSRIFLGNLIYWMGGCLAGKYYEQFMELLREKNIRKKIIIVTCLVFAIFIPYCYVLTYFTSGVSPNIMPVLVSIREIMHILGCVCAAPLTLIISDLIAQRYEKLVSSRIFGLLSESTYYIYLIHCLFINHVDKISYEHNITRVRDILIFKMFFVTIVSVVFSMLVIWISGLLGKIRKPKL